MELLPVVNENDEIIEYKNRVDLLKTDIIRISALWVVNSKNQVLLAQRSFNKKMDPGKWGPAVIGAVNKDESYEDHIYKEAHEELGIEARGFIKGPKKFMNYDYPYFGQWFICTLEQNARTFIIQKDEVEQVDWFDIKDLFEDVKNNPDKFVKSANIWEELFSDNNLV